MQWESCVWFTIWYISKSPVSDRYGFWCVFTDVWVFITCNLIMSRRWSTIVLNLQVFFLIFWTKLWYMLKGFPGNWVQILFMDGETKNTHEIVYGNVVWHIYSSRAEDSVLRTHDFVSMGMCFPVSRRIIAPSFAGNTIEFKGTMILLEHQELHTQRHSITF
jgi:hypothetical protein